ncbi:MAG: acyl carrier protein [Acidimicrobiales bacterium]|nr:acyl carrier protein [Acidimicrobiia bacterium]NNF55119.1 acyl carrier protein [Acidimicrobiales bacterium]
MKTLTNEAANAIVVEAICAVAPDTANELAGIGLDQDVFQALELDSMDHVNVITRIWEETGIEIAERDYGRLRTLDSLTTFLISAMGSGSERPKSV